MTKRVAVSAAGLLASVVIVAAAASLGGLFGPGDWYRSLVKPDWNPPNWVFGPVWSFLYLSMAVAGWLVWMRRGERPVGVPLALHGAQLLLNAAWTPLFFGLHWLGLAFAEILVLEVFIIACIAAFWPVSRWAAALMVPYAAWVAFAAFLNFTLWRLN